MTLEESKTKFIDTWGGLGSAWGISKSMAQMHAFLLTSPEAMSMEDIMEELNMSRGNVNLNVRSLVDWGLVERISVKGERKEYFRAEKDIWRIATKIAGERRKRELEPVVNTLMQVKDIDPADRKKKEAQQFIQFIESLEDFVRKVDGALELFVKADSNWFAGTLLKLIK
ncbi:MAG: GbsR/MarR family transcriptional regulator [Flavobacteriales bacterium]|jgi:DNA-binding transcriptional regulator GbsR (MarR family)